MKLRIKTNNPPKLILMLTCFISILCSCGTIASYTKIKQAQVEHNYETRLYMADMNCYSPLNIKVCDQIVAFSKKVAFGEQTETTMQLDVKDLLGKTEFSAQELGIKNITADNMYPLGWGILDYKISTFMDAMLYEHPFEFFWFDKLEGTYTDEWEVSCKDNILYLPEYITVHMNVCDDCRGENQYSVNPERVAEANIAREYALSLVEEAKPLSDLEKLQFYCDSICDLTDYYHKENKNDSFYPYGVPYQITSVFDQNRETLSICEAYTKAFQFLCDNTEFEGNIWCFSVRCKKNNGQHVVNIVHMDDDKFYLADITSTDVRSKGKERVRFLKGADSGSPEKGFVYEEKILQSEQGSYTVLKDVYMYRENMLELWDYSMLNISKTDYECL